MKFKQLLDGSSVHKFDVLPPRATLSLENEKDEQVRAMEGDEYIQEDQPNEATIEVPLSIEYPNLTQPYTTDYLC